MRFALLLAVVVLAGCGGPVRTVQAASAPAVAYGAHGERYAWDNNEVVAPVFRHDRAAVMAACELACDTYCHDAPDLVDRAAWELHVVDVNAWTGTVPLTVALVDLGDGATRMDMEAGVASDFIGDSSALQAKRLRGFADAVARHLRAAELASHVQAAGAAQAQTVQDGTEIPMTTPSSAMSRP